MAQQEKETERAGSVLRRNAAALAMDYAFFGMGMAFAGTSTTLPAFAARLTSSAVLIGLVSSLWNGGWLLPQIAAAHYLTPVRRKAPVVIAVSWIGRPVYLLLGLFLLLGGARWPGLTLGLFLAAVFIFAATDALTVVAWFDVLAKAIAGNLRGRVIGIGQLVSGLLSLGAGALVRMLLAEDGPPFPTNYAIIFILATAAYFASLAAFYFVREPLEPVPAARPRISHLVPRLARLLVDDHRFRKVTLVRLLVGLSAMALPFYAVYSTLERGLPESTIGLFLVAQTLGGVVAGLVLGPLADRTGAHRVVQVMGLCQFLAPVMALVTSRSGIVSAGALTAGFTLVFLLLGIGEGSTMLGVLNYVLEIAPAHDRPSYMGLTNTLSGIIILYPILGGWIVTRWGYQAMFALSAAVILVGGLLALGLPSARSPEPGS
jgi:MFS family permease